MNSKHFLPAIWTAVTVYCVSSMLFGTMGLVSMRVLIKERDRLAVNMERLESINRDLGGSMDALRYDADTLSVYARELGYGAVDERFVRIIGVPAASRRSVAAGNLVLPEKPGGIGDRELRIVSIAAGLSVFGLLSLRRTPRRNISG